LAKDVTDKMRNEVKQMVYGNFPHIDFAPIVFVSGLTGFRVHTLLPLIMDIWEARHTTVDETDLRQFLRTVTVDHHPTIDKGSRPPEILAMTQEGINPPVFQMLIKYRTSVHISYVHYIERRLREKFNFLGTPVMIKLKKMKR
jgi:GTP-binding protein